MRHRAFGPIGRGRCYRPGLATVNDARACDALAASVPLPRSTHPAADPFPVPVATSYSRSHMALDPRTLTLQTYPAPVLRKKAQPVSGVPPVNEEVRAVAARMIEVMRQEEGIGLAAPQIGLPWRMFVVDVPPTDGRSTESDPPTATHGTQVYINPVLSHPAGAPVAFEEGCLSLPEIRGEVLRPPVITITAVDLEGRTFTRTAGGLLARCWQHENDHLDGVLIIDRMTQMSRIKNRSAIRDLERDA
jgi:peptide deformylase